MLLGHLQHHHLQRPPVAACRSLSPGSRCWPYSPSVCRRELLVAFCTRERGRMQTLGPACCMLYLFTFYLDSNGSKMPHPKLFSHATRRTALHAVAKGSASTARFHGVPGGNTCSCEAGKRITLPIPRQIWIIKDDTIAIH